MTAPCSAPPGPTSNSAGNNHSGGVKNALTAPVVRPGVGGRMRGVPCIATPLDPAIRSGPKPSLRSVSRISATRGATTLVVSIPRPGSLRRRPGPHSPPRERARAQRAAEWLREQSPELPATVRRRGRRGRFDGRCDCGAGVGGRRCQRRRGHQRRGRRRSHLDRGSSRRRCGGGTAARRKHSAMDCRPNREWPIRESKDSPLRVREAPWFREPASRSAPPPTRFRGMSTADLHAGRRHGADHRTPIRFGSRSTR